MAARVVVVADPSEIERRRLATLVAEVAQSRALSVEVHEAEHGESALAMVEVHGAELLVCEVLLERMSGLELLRRLRRPGIAGASPTTAVMLVTEMCRETDRYWALRNGAHAYVTKPCTDDSLRARIARVLEAGPGSAPERALWAETPS